MRVICLFSGGVDSTVLLHKLINEGHSVVALSFDYGQTHIREIRYAKEYAEKLNVQHQIFSLPFLSQMRSESKLLGGNGSVIVPCRNTLMITSAWALAESLEFDAVAIGAHATDDEGFPDCRAEFLKCLENVLQLGSGRDIVLLRPFVYKSKSSVVDIGKALGVDFSKTYTCYKGGEVACGECASCIGRKLAGC